MTSDEILSSPPIVSFSTFKPGFSKYMQFTYNNKDDITGKTEYTITLNDNYKYIVDILVVGGGGASPFAGGGGGAGSIVYIVNKILDAGTYKIIVGNGGTDIINGTNGNNSMITFENGNTVILDGIALKAFGGQSGSIGVNIGTDKIGGNGGDSYKNTFWNGKSYESTVFKGASGGVNFSGGGGGSSNEGKDINGGDGSIIDITGNNELYGSGGGGGRSTVDSNGNMTGYIGGDSFDNPGSGGSTGIFSTNNSAGKPGIVIISYKTEKIQKNKKLFCKVEDSNKNKYILTDKYKQPLQCYNDKCIIFNRRQQLEDPSRWYSLEDLIIDTKIQCKAIRDSSGNIVDGEPINKSNINFDNYNIASINKNIIISNTENNYKLTPEEIEKYFNEIYLDTNELDILESPGEGIPLYNAKSKYNYLGPKSDLLIQEDITKINPKPSDNNMYIGIGIGIGIFFFLLFFAFLYYNSGTVSPRADGTNTTNKIKKNK
jgi:hypothetical protein